MSSLLVIGWNTSGIERCRKFNLLIWPVIWPGCEPSINLDVGTVAPSHCPPNPRIHPSLWPVDSGWLWAANDPARFHPGPLRNYLRSVWNRLNHCDLELSFRGMGWNLSEWSAFLRCSRSPNPPCPFFNYPGGKLSPDFSQKGGNQKR